MKNKKIFIWLLVFLFSISYFSPSKAWQDPYVTSYNYSYDENYTDVETYWDACRWNISNHIYQCEDGSVWASPGDCSGIGGGGASYYGWNAFNSCTGQYICSNAGVPDPGGSWRTRPVTRTRRVSGTAYNCNYISAVTSWTACVNHVHAATAVTWSSISGTSCSNVPTTGSCNNPPTATIDLPAGAVTINYQESVNFSGHGADTDGTVVKYEWWDGGCGSGTLLNSGTFASNPTAAYSNNNLSSTRTHNIYFRVQDDWNTWSACNSRQVTVRPVCSPSTPPVEAAFCSGDNTNLPGSSNITATDVNVEANCTNGRKCEYYYPPIPGDGGSACGGTFCNSPTENLCSSGTPTAVTESSDGNYWQWTCTGRHGGSDESCQALKSCAQREVSPN